MLGKTTGGGACDSRDCLLADGTGIIYSTDALIVSVKNDSVYSIDRGIAPDIDISTPAAFYDRTALTKMIDGLL